MSIYISSFCFRSSIIGTQNLQLTLFSSYGEAAKDFKEGLIQKLDQDELIFANFDVLVYIYVAEKEDVTNLVRLSERLVLLFDNSGFELQFRLIYFQIGFFAKMIILFALSYSPKASTVTYLLRSSGCLTLVSILLQANVPGAEWCCR